MDIDEPSDPVGRPGQVDELVLSGSAGERDVADGRVRIERGDALDRLVVVVRAGRHDRVDQHLDRPADPAPFPIEADGSWRSSRTFRRRRFSSAGHHRDYLAG
jgi:hypothetical protein